MARLGLAPYAPVPRQDPAGVGRAVCQVVLNERHRDGSNQLGDENNGAPYSDYTRYRPVNTLTRVRHLDRWQPVVSANLARPSFLAPHWGRVRPFAFAPGGEALPPAPPDIGSRDFRRQVEQVLTLSAALTDRDKAIIEYWMDGPLSETPPGHWNLLAQQVSRRDAHALDADVVMFFALNSALMDAGIAAWHCKRHFDSVRPMTAVHELYRGETVRAWGGPGKGTRAIDGGEWQPYQRANAITPPFPEYVSGHSTFSAAAAEVLRRFTGSDDFGGSHTVEARSSRIESGIVPGAPVTLAWATFTAAADEAGMSRRFGGIHFESGDLEGQRLGRGVAASVWRRGLEHVGPRAASSRSTQVAPAADTPRARGR